MPAPTPRRGQLGLTRSRRSRAWLLVAVLILCTAAAGGVFWRERILRTAQATARVAPAIPVTIAEAAYRNVPIYLAGLGNVQAYNTIAIHTQINGTLQSVDFVEGHEVHKGDTLAQIDPRYYQDALNQAKAKKGEDQAQLVSAKQDLKRIKTLLAKTFETQQDLDHQIALVGQLQATIKVDQAAIESAQTQLNYTTIKAPTDGLMGIRQVDPGNFVQTTDTTPIVVLTQMRPISIVFTLPETDLSDVRQAMARGPVTAVAYDQNDTRLLGTGTLTVVDNEVAEATSTIHLKATFPNNDETLWPGEFVHVRILVETRKHVVTVPSVTVQRGPQGLYAWIVRPDNTVSARPIEVGPSQNNMTIINGGISAGERVVVDGQYRLQPGSRVHINGAPTATVKKAIS